MPAVEELPSTIKRSPKKAQNTWIKAHDSAVKEYGEGRRAHMTAFAALKHSFEKVGDHWEAKDGKGPSDKGATDRSGRTEEGVDANASKDHLMQVAGRLGVTGRSRMTKQDLVEAIKKANRSATAKSRSNGKASTKPTGTKSTGTKSTGTKSTGTKSTATKSTGTKSTGTKSGTKAASSSKSGTKATSKVRSGPKSSSTKKSTKSTKSTKSAPKKSTAKKSTPKKASAAKSR